MSLSDVNKAIENYTIKDRTVMLQILSLFILEVGLTNKIDDQKYKEKFVNFEKEYKETIDSLKVDFPTLLVLYLS